MVVPRLFKQSTVGTSCIYVFFFCGPYYLIIYYLPIYFQSVGGSTATMSGVYNIPLILAVTVMMIASGIIISKTNIVIPLQVVGAAVGTIGSGLLYTLNVNTGLGKWIGFQIFGGIGWGLAFQIPIIVAQSNATPEDMSPVTAMILRKCTHSFVQSNLLTPVV